MEYLLVSLSLFQFLFRVIGLQASSIYTFINPYVLALPFIIFWLGSALAGGLRTDRNLFVAWIILLAFPSVMLRNFNGDPNFFFLFLRGLQYFWGPLLLVPALLGIFRMAGRLEVSDRPIQRYVFIMASIAGSLTLCELVAVHLLGIAPLTIPWVGAPNASTISSNQDINPFRPWGLPSHPQANALIMAYLFWLSMLWSARGLYGKTATAAGVVLSGSGTGQAALAGLSLLGIRRPLIPLLVILAPVSALVGWATLTNQYSRSGGAIGKIDLVYLEKLVTLFSTVANRFLAQFSTEELLFGTNNPTIDVVVGYNHDWAYLDVFYAYGAVGVVGYLLLFGGLLFLALPGRVSSFRRVFFALAGLVLNFHYGTLNFYVGQFVFASVVALRLDAYYAREIAAFAKTA